MVLKPQLLELAKKQYFPNSGKMGERPSHLLLAILQVRNNQIFLTDGITVVATKKQQYLNNKLQLVNNEKIELKDMEGFVCLFKNSQFEMFPGSSFERLDEKFLQFENNKNESKLSTSASFIKRSGVANLGSNKSINVETNVQLNNENDMNTSNKLSKRISKKKSPVCSTGFSQFKLNRKNPTKNYSCNLFLDFKSFSVVCPYGGYYLRGTLQMLMDNLSETQLIRIQQSWKLNKHIAKLTTGNDKHAPIIDISNILVRTIRKNSYDEDQGTATSTPPNSGLSRKFKRRNNKFKNKLQISQSQII